MCVLNNRFDGSQSDFLSLVGDRTIFANNVVTQGGAGAHLGIIVSGNDNLVLDNLFQFSATAHAVIEVGGTANALGGNVATPLAEGRRWRIGILFHEDGNYYGNNVFAADTLVETNGTSQVDWGGNVKL